MNETSILKELESLGIITKIAGQYFITEKYKELLNTPVVDKKPTSIPEKINNYNILNTEGSESAWPADVKHTAGRVRADHFMTYFKVPIAAPDGSYRLRSLPIACLSIIDNIIEDTSINPAVMQKAVSLYYEHTKFPKTFKNLLLEGEIVSIYNEYLSGEFLRTINPPDKNNQQCR